MPELVFHLMLVLLEAARLPRKMCKCASEPLFVEVHQSQTLQV